MEDVEKFLLAGRGIVDGEPLTLQWYAVKYTSESYASTPTFAIFDTFAGEEGRGAHLTGMVISIAQRQRSCADVLDYDQAKLQKPWLPMHHL